MFNPRNGEAAGMHGSLRAASRALLVLAVVVGSACESDAYDVEKNLSYDPTLDIYGSFDFYQPKSDSSGTDRPAILAIHGGAWRTGDKAWGSQIAEEFCPFGYVVVSINYRLAGRPNGTWPAQIEEVQKALRYVRGDAARLRMHPARIAALGV